MAELTETRRAWRVLRRTAQRLDTAALPGMTGQLARSLPSKQALYTGYRPAAAQAELVAQGLAPEAAQALVRAAVLRQFQAFAYSWGGYCANHGWLYELGLLEEGQRNELTQRCFPAGLPDFAGLIQLGRRAAVQALPAAMQLGRQLGQLEQGEAQANPGWVLLTMHHRLHPELAAAVLCQCRSAPAWAIPLVAAFGVLCLGLLAGAVLHPGTPDFAASAPGPGGFMGRAALLLFGLLFLVLAVYMALDKPRRERQAREHLRRFEASGGPAAQPSV